MSKSLYIAVEDEVTGYCPECRCPKIKLVYDTGGGAGGYFEMQRYLLQCEHQHVCGLRRDFKRRDA